MNRHNLSRLVTALSNLPEKSKLDMENLVEGGGHVDNIIDEKRNCPTVACALGYSPYLVEPALEGETWQEYAERVYEIDTWSREWDWLFSHRWAKYNGSVQDAILRINLLLNHEQEVDLLLECMDWDSLTDLDSGEGAELVEWLAMSEANKDLAKHVWQYGDSSIRPDQPLACLEGESLEEWLADHFDIPDAVVPYVEFYELMRGNNLYEVSGNIYELTAP